MRAFRCDETIASAIIRIYGADKLSTSPSSRVSPSGIYISSYANNNCRNNFARVSKRSRFISDLPSYIKVHIVDSYDRLIIVQCFPILGDILLSCNLISVKIANTRHKSSFISFVQPCINSYIITYFTFQ